MVFLLVFFSTFSFPSIKTEYIAQFIFITWLHEFSSVSTFLMPTLYLYGGIFSLKQMRLHLHCVTVVWSRKLKMTAPKSKIGNPAGFHWICCPQRRLNSWIYSVGMKTRSSAWVFPSPHPTPPMFRKCGTHL